jgi:hypothetical protein
VTVTLTQPLHNRKPFASSARRAWPSAEGFFVPLDPDVLSWVAVIGAGIAVVALVLATLALARVRGLRRAYTLLQGDDGADSFMDAVGVHVREVSGLRGEVEAVQRRLDTVQGDLAAALRHVAVVRYDAFNDMGGRLSFSVALLDDVGDGLVLTSINGRTETRTYSKGVKAGSSEASLSPEEEQAVGFALRSRGQRA